MRSNKEASGVVRDIVDRQPDTGPCLRVYKYSASQTISHGSNVEAFL
jgi:hypothetical protein